MKPRGKQRKRKQVRDASEGLPLIHANAAGIDVGNRDHYVAVPVGRDPRPGQKFSSFTTDLHRMADWLKACGMETVVMQATGVDWGGLFEVLEQHGLHVQVVKSQHTKTLSGPKNECQESP